MLRQANRFASEAARSSPVELRQGYKYAAQHRPLNNGWEEEMSDVEGLDLPEDRMKRVKRLLLRLLAAQELPANPLDDLIHELGGPGQVR